MNRTSHQSRHARSASTSFSRSEKEDALVTANLKLRRRIARRLKRIARLHLRLLEMGAAVRAKRPRQGRSRPRAARRRGSPRHAAPARRPPRRGCCQPQPLPLNEGAPASEVER
jgi:hypothetical protein